MNEVVSITLLLATILVLNAKHFLRWKGSKAYWINTTITKVLLFLMLFLIGPLSFAQVGPPILSGPRQKGIYRDFQEFLNNAPSIHSPFLMISQSGKNKIEKGTEDYRLLLVDSATKRREIKKFWGACDGETVFINEVNYGGSLNFKRVHGLGRYCYFKGTRVEAPSAIVGAGIAAGAVGAGVAVAVVEIDGDYPYILNINNGKFFLLDRDVLEMILEKDKELYALYDDEKRKSQKNTLLSYIVKYNERNEDEIRYNRPKPINVTFYRKQKKELVEPIHVMVGDTIQLSLDRNSIKQVTWLGDSLDICVGSNCKTISLEKNKVYVECSWNSEQQEIKKVDIKVGEFHEREILIYSEKNK